MTNPKYISSKLRDLVAKRANFVCEYCKAQENFSADSFSVEHIKPIILGG
jgi:molybdenum cofactor biosynthesis enzyme MoaA